MEINWRFPGRRQTDLLITGTIAEANTAFRFGKYLAIFISNIEMAAVVRRGRDDIH